MPEDYSEILSKADTLTKALMERHGVSLKTGFLTENCPRMLPINFAHPERNKYFNTLSRIIYGLSHFIREGVIDEEVRDLQIPEQSFNDLSLPVIFRLQLIYSMITHAWFIEKYEYKTVSELMRDDSVKHLPSQLAVPLWELSKITGIAPSMSYCLYSLWNYYSFPSSKSTDLEDKIEVLHTFTNTVDEKWFVKIHQMVETTIEPAEFNLTKANILISYYYHGHRNLELIQEIGSCFKLSGDAASQAVNILKRMGEYCDPEIYYNKIRIFYSFPRNVVFDGVDELRGEPQNLFGETGAQSPFMHFLDYMLSIDFDDDRFLPEMQKHMPENFRKFLGLAKHSQIREFVLRQKDLGNKELVSGYNAIVQAILDWRGEHLRLADDYIRKHGDGYGTGKSPMDWLQSIYDKTKTYLID